MLRILHTSDWHLGQHFIGKSREAEHRAFFHWLKTTITAQQVDVLLVAGDIFDTATPPSYARELYNQLVVDLAPTGVQIVLLGGNHDSVAVLAESASLLACLRTQVVPGYSTAADAHLITLQRRSGEPAAVLAALPFLRPRDLSQRDDFKSSAGVQASDKQRQLQQQIALVYQELYDAAVARATALAAQAGLTEPLPVIASGHLTTVGASSTESVREIYIGTLDAFPASAFPPFAYIALGHIHQAQQVAGSECIRYCGAPLALSFDEAAQQKYCLLVSVGADATHAKEVTSTWVQVEPLPLPVWQPLLSLQTDLASLPALLQPALAKLAADQQLWLELVLTGDSALLSDVQQQLEQQLQDLPVQLLRLRRLRREAVSLQQSGLSLQELTPTEVFAERLSTETLPDTQCQRLTELHQQAWQLVLAAEADAAASSAAVTPETERLS
jgi:exonuclease SbcD